MRETEPDTVQDSPRKLDPPVKIRAALWFGIYFAAQLPLISMTAGFYLFPTGLFKVLIPVGTNGISGPGPLFWFVLFGPYVIYLVHLIATLNVRSKAVFQILLVVLIVLVVLNLAGCESIVQGLHNIN